jgi:predicted ATPase/class 3 adenylate cyclase
MSTLPSGTVTLLFTDVEGSTRLLRELGDAYAEAVAEHRRLLREAVALHGGVEVDAVGDGFLAAFARASDAVRAAALATGALAGGPLRPRIALHTGEPLLTDEGYVGLDVHQVARICAAGHGGQVLVSEQTARLLGRATLRDLGEQRLPDLPGSNRLYQLGDEEFPPLRTIPRTSLPTPPTAFVGRERELADAGALLRSERLVTLVGPGGSGKTRLALRVAADAAGEFPDGAFWVPLQDLRDPGLVPNAIAYAVGAATGAVDHLRNRHALLVLDNFEQVAEAAPAIADLLAAAPAIRVLVTSREPLHVAAEHVYPVQPLVEADAVALFEQRARAVKPDFAPIAATAELCRRLDCLPLAIELAAARANVLTPEALLARLGQRLPLLTGGARDAPARQRTVRATIEWSYELLKPDEQELLGSLSVFHGWTLEAAEAVCGCDVDALAALVDKSVVVVHDDRFLLLETIREFAGERLVESSRADDVRRRHAEYFVQEAEARRPERFTSLLPAALEWFTREHENIQAALDELHKWTDPEPELRLATACFQFWHQRGYFSTEGWKRCMLALERGGAAKALAAPLMSRVARFCMLRGDYEQGRELAEAALALHLELGTTGRDLLAAYNNVGSFAQMRDDHGVALELFEHAVELARAQGDDVMSSALTHNIGVLRLERGELAAARSDLEESVMIARRAGDARWIATSLADLGYVALEERRVDDAAQCLREALAVFRTGGYVNEDLVEAVDGVAAVAIARDNPHLAVVLLAALARIRAELSMIILSPVTERIRARTLEQARSQLGDAAFTAAWAEGEALSLEEAAERAERVH